MASASETGAPRGPGRTRATTAAVNGPADAVRALNETSATVAGFRDRPTPNRAPEAVGTLPDRALRVQDGATGMDVSTAFRDPEDDALTYGALSSAPGVAAVGVIGNTATVTPLAAGEATITVTATDLHGSNSTAKQMSGPTGHAGSVAGARVAPAERRHRTWRGGGPAGGWKLSGPGAAAPSVRRAPPRRARARRPRGERAGPGRRRRRPAPARRRQCAVRPPRRRRRRRPAAAGRLLPERQAPRQGRARRGPRRGPRLDHPVLGDGPGGRRHRGGRAEGERGGPDLRPGAGRRLRARRRDRGDGALRRERHGLGRAAARPDGGRRDAADEASGRRRRRADVRLHRGRGRPRRRRGPREGRRTPA